MNILLQVSVVNLVTVAIHVHLHAQYIKACGSTPEIVISDVEIDHTQECNSASNNFRMDSM